MSRRSFDFSYGSCPRRNRFVEFAVCAIWCGSLLLSLTISATLLAALVAGLYFLLTGEFILR